MDITHIFNKKEVKGEGEGNFFLSNNKGGYFTLGNSIISQYNGWFYFLEDEWNTYKIIENLGIKDTPNKIINHGSYVDKLYDDSRERFFLADEQTLFYYIKNYEGLVDLFIDFRKIHDFNNCGRIYDYYFEKGCLIIEYKKYSDDSLNVLIDKKFLVIKGFFDVVDKKEWVYRDYSYDKLRNTKYDFHVFFPFSFNFKSKNTESLIVFRFSNDKDSAITECMRHYHNSIESNVLKNIDEIDSKIACAKLAFNNVITRFESKNTYGIFAGFPWFFQVWARDELISCAGFLVQKHFWIMKEILMNYWNSFLENGLISNRRPSSDLGSADGVGWLFKRTLDLLISLENKHYFDEYFDKEELVFIYVKLLSSLDKLFDKKSINGLIYNDALETWMDTHGGFDDNRSGFRIEIQALILKGLELSVFISKKLGVNFNKHENRFNNFKNLIVEKFVHDGILRDGLEFDKSVDFKTRPNIFLAYYVCPDLVSLEVWKKTFDLVLQECWLDWGGLSSISKNDPLFQPEHSGMNNKSYHRGDSWYFINNIAAICLFDLDKKIGKNIYAQFSEKIRKASVKEMMFSGYIGQCAEISDAKEMSSKGCFAQAWSAATLLELLSKYK
ncbi:hypothetical protein K9L67_02775 [Candidatus Woesearchaeota archaeon]|nr:hypothetical protein [Candidatus Woesearchaeota archaeon]MCF7901126.1 hypothetical protein [Candidatus Woesearchaeota archaeon]MCF8012885.1 hypothetical protein [Candidatus Woesearchaeota archaeon]